MNRKIEMKSNKGIRKCKPKCQGTLNNNAGSKASFGEVENATKLGVKQAPMNELTYSSFKSVISDCSSCEQQQRTKVVNLESVEEDCENILLQFTEAFAQIDPSLTSSDNARQIGIRCLEYANLVSFNIERLERERNQAVDHRTELEKNFIKLQQDKIDLQNEINSMQQINAALKQENTQTSNELDAQNEKLDSIRKENDSYRTIIEDQKSAINAELKKVSDSSIQLERCVVEKEINWDNLNYHLQKRVAELHHDHEQLKANYSIMYRALHTENGGDMDHEPMMDVGLLEAGHEAEMVMMKCIHESYISELNKSNCKLWNEKFFMKCRFEEEMRKSELYENWLTALKHENSTYCDEINLNSQVEQWLDNIYLILKNVANE